MYITFHLKHTESFTRASSILTIYHYGEKKTDFAMNSDLFRIQLLKKLLTHTSSLSFTALLIHQAIHQATPAPKGTPWHGWGKGVLTVPSTLVVSVFPCPKAHIFFKKSFSRIRDPQPWQRADCPFTLTLPTGQAVATSSHLFMAATANILIENDSNCKWTYTCS